VYTLTNIHIHVCIYKHRPGSGSDEITAGTRSVLGKVLRGLGVDSMLDIGCGDWNWMKLLNLSRVKYTGIDIVEEVRL
jgi:hypothetical protein